MTDATLPAVQIPGSMPAINSTVLMDPKAYLQMMQVAEFMAKGVATIPKHLQGKPSDCLAIVMQSMVWGLLPHVVAQKTYLTPNGIIGYEGQLVHAVAVNSGVFEGHPQFEYFGDWSKIRGKNEWVKKTGSDDDGKGYYKATYTKAEEAGLGVKVIAAMRGESEPRVLEVFLTQCQPRFSTNWAIDPEQQICYVAMRRFVRRFCPGVLMGIYTADELDDMPPSEQVDENTRRGREQPRKDDIKAEYPEDRFTQNLPKWRKMIEDGKNTPANVIALISGEYSLTANQKAQIESITQKRPEVQPGTPADASTTVAGGAQ